MTRSALFFRGVLILSMLLAVVVLAGHTPRPAQADPCGMVPPIHITNSGAISRVGLQQTYVFHKDGVETFVIRPGFTGNVEQFGMLIPFPTPPALRKVGDDIFSHVTAAVDPPEVVYNLRFSGQQQGQQGAGQQMLFAREANLELRDEVRVIKQEAVGMYEVAVLDAGSATALKKWMTDHEYRFPNGMEDVCNDYVELGWCFVAIKTQVSGSSGVDPKPGMRNVTAGLPQGSAFQGAVQGMGFRFQTDELVVPMRLSAFNEGELRNVVYLLTDSPKRVRAIPEEYVVRQINGEDLFRNLTEPLPLRIVGGAVADIPESAREWLQQQRDPAAKNGLAAELFAGDMLAARSGELSHQHEEREKMLLRIGESLQVRGPEIDRVNYDALEGMRQQVLLAALADVKDMTLTVIDGDFPREVLGAQNLKFVAYDMPNRRNSPRVYDCQLNGPRGRLQEGTLLRGELLGTTGSPANSQRDHSRGLPFGMALGFTVLLLGAIALRGWRRNSVGGSQR